MEPADFVAQTRRLGPLVHLATVAPDGSPHVAPVHTDWHDGHLYVMVGLGNRKTHNLRADPRVCLHYQVSEQTNWDSLIVWGTARILDSLEDKRRLWTGALSFDLDVYSPGGPEGSPDTGFLEIAVDRGLLLLRYGLDGRDEWVP